MTETESNPYGQIKTYERNEFDRLSRYLSGLDADGWVEQSYCTDWGVYQTVSHIGSGSRIGAARLKSWVGGEAPLSREGMQAVWGFFDALAPSEMFAAYSAAADEYVAAETSTPDAAGLQEVDGFAGRRPMYAYQLGRVWELALHAWDVYVTRDPTARLDPAAVVLLAANLQFMNLPIDKQRAAALTTNPIVFHLTDSDRAYTLDPTADRPRLAAGAATDAPLVIDGPDEEIIRLVAGRDFVPGTLSRVKVVNGTPNDLANLRRAFR